MYSKPPDRVKPTNQSKSSLSQQSKAKQSRASRTTRAKQASEQVKQRRDRVSICLPGHSASLAINLLANCPFTTHYDPPCLAYFIVVVSAATAVATTVQKFIVVG